MFATLVDIQHKGSNKFNSFLLFSKKCWDLKCISSKIWAIFAEILELHWDEVIKLDFWMNLIVYLSQW